MKRSIVAFLKGIIPVMVALVFVIAVSGCQRQEGKEGTMEKAGKKLTKALRQQKMPWKRQEKKREAKAC